MFLSCNRPNRNSESENTKRINSNSTRDNSLTLNNKKQATSVHMTNTHGVFEVPITVNGTLMNFIFDTGASSISISSTEAMFLYKQGTISDDDILGSIFFQDATGAVYEGTQILLKSVKIGTREIHNVKASVVHNLEAPLLLGQSALGEFGKVTIDYNENIISFE
ncbi:retropepsin-like aspartic protease family protein [Cellulophaga algicola]|nr:retropepsin-like aspartic protease [Cellulophaga algicola]